jgi:uncharacterized protein
MSRENVEVVRSLYEAFDSNDTDAATRLTDPDVEWTTAERVPHAGTYRGRDRVRQFLEDQRAPFAEFLIEPEEFFERGDQVVAFLRIRARPAGSDAVVELRIGHLWTVRDGRVLRGWSYPERENALEAAGLSE